MNKEPRARAGGSVSDKPGGRSSGRPPRPKANARAVAFNILHDVTQLGSYASLALDGRLRVSSLIPEDRALVTRLIYGAIEEWALLDYRVDKYLTEPDHVAPAARDLLRLGAYQILFLDRVPDSAAVNETVALAQQFPAALPYAGMINHALRRLSEDKGAPVVWPSDPLVALSIQTSWPEWALRKLSNAYGPGEMERVAKLRAEGTGVTVRFNPLATDADTFERRMDERGWEWSEGLIPGSYYIAKGLDDISGNPDYRAGRFSVEGTASMLAAEAVGAGRGMRILDACAAPGGKTAFMSERMSQSGRVYALDKYPRRVEMIRAQAARLLLDNIKPIECDASSVNREWIDWFDAALVDAPCTGLGVAIDKPDIRYRLSRDALDSLAVVQRGILDACASYVKPGGTLVYSTCSILPEENARRIESFLSTHGDYTLDRSPMRGFVPGEFGLQLLPRFIGGEKPIWLEGFFIAKMIRSAGARRSHA
ncbi:MAG: 16S rRNA (cytosine(967)-C(5))-methyltransferase RsmB [Oscillospiraceae bacterium]|jgi:16S rRNA (cytosine967-C5)-methyltransferase|nr:16S rRNA (cytosine(967)-C(5))-methyltransferase RsmB [Oscillospiraceae bacterium]